MVVVCCSITYVVVIVWATVRNRAPFLVCVRAVVSVAYSWRYSLQQAVNPLDLAADFISDCASKDESYLRVRVGCLGRQGNAADVSGRLGDLKTGADLA
jgi:hypothetical protein